MLLRCDLYNKAGVGERQGVRPALGEARRGRQLMDKQQLFGSKQRGAARLSLFSLPRTRQDGEKKQKKAARNKAKLPSDGPFSAALPDCRGGEIHFMPPHSHCSLSVSLRHADGLVSNPSLWRANLDCEIFLANTMRFFSKFATQAKETLSLSEFLAPSIHPSVHLLPLYLESGRGGQQSQRRHPDFPRPSHLLQLIPRDHKASRQVQQSVPT